MKYNERGFAIYAEIKDTRDNTIRVQESSVGTHVWLFVKPGLGDVHDPHLTPGQARELAKALLKFVDGDRRGVNVTEWAKNIGKTVLKKSGKPFKSSYLYATVTGVIESPKTGRPAYTFVEDDSFVECTRCVVVPK